MTKKNIIKLAVAGLVFMAAGIATGYTLAVVL